MAKLASFDLKHLPGKRNVVADKLSRDPFGKPFRQRLLEEPTAFVLLLMVPEACLRILCKMLSGLAASLSLVYP